MIPLPDPSQRARVGNATDILGPDRPNEVINKSPGPIDDTEHVVVGLAPDGAPASVQVDQTLVISGVGDFSLKIPGPALDVHAAPDAANQPGLRRGSVVWEGFAGGTKQLEATVELQPDLEQLRLPISVTVTAGSVRIENRTAIPVPMVDGDPLPGSAEAALRAVAQALRSGTRPVAGAGGVPASIPALSPPATTDVPVAAPFHVRGAVTTATGDVPFDAVLPGPQAPDGVLTVNATGTVRFSAEPSIPDPSTLDGLSGRAAVRALETALWATLRLDDVSAYLGNPRPGRSSTTFSYEPAAVKRVAAAPEATERPRPIAIGLTLMVSALMIAGLAVVWARN